MKETTWITPLLVGTFLLSGVAGAQDAADIKPFSGNRTNAALGPLCVPGPTDLCIPLDDSFTVVRFDGTGGSGEADPADPCQFNDDDVSLPIPLQFSFDFYGMSYTEIFINNNGNISFGVPFSTFTPTGFPVSGFPMIAPFWADVDTRGVGSGTVWMRSEPNRFVVTWERVGYYSGYTDKLNTFQLIISDGTDPLVGLGNNVCFCYDDVQWTTGDASGGSGGFGGSPATAGSNQGNGVDFFQVGVFDHAGADYDGPAGNVDGVDFLDDTTFCFSTSGTNVPPIFTKSAGPFELVPGDVVSFDIEAIGPELNQTTTMTVDTGGLANFSFNSTAGNPATAACTFSPAPGQEGTHIVTFTATDDGAPVAVASLEVMFVVNAGTATCFGVGCPCNNDDPEAGCVNSTGVGARLDASGSPGIGFDDLVFTMTDLPLFRFAVVFMGTGVACSPLGDGIVSPANGPQGGAYLRFFPVHNSGVSGTITTGPGLAAYSVSFGAPGTILAGSSWEFQGVYRDRLGPCGTGFNLTNGYSVTFLP